VPCSTRIRRRFTFGDVDESSRSRNGAWHRPCPIADGFTTRFSRFRGRIVTPS
jgi:hypothetical protein